MSRTRLSPEEMRRLLGETVVDAASLRAPAAAANPVRPSAAAAAQTPAPASRRNPWLGWVVALLIGGVGGALVLNQLQSPTDADPNGANSQANTSPAQSNTAAQAATTGSPAAVSNTQPEGSVLDASGYVNAARVATVSSVTTGRLLEVLVDEGARVKQGQLLARLDSADIERQVALAEAQVQSARTNAEQQKVQLAEAREQLARLEKLFAQSYVSEDELKSAQYSVSRLEVAQTASANEITVTEKRLAIQQQLLANTYIYAPFAGLVVERAAEVGEIVSPVSAGGGFTRTGIFTLLDTSAMEAHAKINESYIKRIQRGQEVIITPRSYPELSLRGEVSTIMPVAERETASVKVIVTFLETDERVLPNMSVDLTFNAMNTAPGEAQLAAGSTLR